MGTSLVCLLMFDSAEHTEIGTLGADVDWCPGGLFPSITRTVLYYCSKCRPSTHLKYSQQSCSICLLPLLLKGNVEQYTSMVTCLSIHIVSGYVLDSFNPDLFSLCWWRKDLSFWKQSVPIPDSGSQVVCPSEYTMQICKKNNWIFHWVQVIFISIHILEIHTGKEYVDLHVDLSAT